MGIRYASQSPVEKTTVSVAKEAAALLIKSVADWGNTGQAAWDKRVSETLDIAGKLAKDRAGSYEEGYVYKVSGAVVGVMTLDDDIGCMHIKFLVTHPGTHQAGGIMIEKAVERSCEEGYPGSLELISSSPDSSAAYLALGFTALGGGKRASHRLDPAQSALWTPSGKTFRLAKYSGKDFAI